MPLIRCKFIKQKDMIYISHLDVLRLLDRAFRIAGIKINFSQGFNPHPKISFGQALSLGVASLGEYVDIDIAEKIKEDVFIQKINSVLPDGLKFVQAKYIDENAPSLMKTITCASYIIELKLNKKYTLDDIKSSVDEFMNKDEIIFTKENKKGKLVDLNIRPMIYKLNVISYEDDIVKLDTLVSSSSENNLKVNILVDKLLETSEIEADNIFITRKDFYTFKNGKLVTPI
ncbi:radical SAM-linked protein [Alkalithermobacter thermoalcaliphilus JW-YL-7 = DSM 7308]|uniref:Radical SAM-linked protein n=1 Tax=Alkalithermobacter thermoalcaliphilus JW-YL-7 = DSM 7308 TaxID=1121328 RepID=A0A150FSY3_CLOPD|nr:Protein of unknown function DUF2344 [[Clostridium] paradoxum JW-YL-7 = DSM 7308]SHL03338.1 radical SAM-linked protein [[Clostridium] paradoxum JW-YL-7 = DSM 7308]